MSRNFFNYFYDSEKATLKNWAEGRTRFFSFLTPWLVRAHVHPDAISYLGLSSLLGVMALFLARPFAAVCFLGFYILCDGIDGAYARHLGRPTQAGAFTDIVTDQMGMMVVSLAMIHFQFVPAMLGAVYLVLYILMIALSVVQNAMGIPVQPLFRSKYFLFIVYFIWAIWGYNLAPALMLLASGLMLITTIWSYIRMKNGIFNAIDREPLAKLDQELAAQGKPVPRFLRAVTVLLPVSALVLIALLTEFTYLRTYLGSPSLVCDWTELGPTPGAQADEVPQGLDASAQGFFLSTFQPETHSSHIYQLGPDGHTVLGSFRMPPDTGHTQGLCFHEPYLYAIDRDSRRCLELDPQASRERGHAVILRLFETGLFGSSACAFIVLDGQSYLAVSDYMHTRKTYFLNWQKALEQGNTEGAVFGWYRNTGLGQGLAFDGTYLYESAQSLGHDRVFQLDPGKALASKSLRSGVIQSFATPGRESKDLAVRGGNFIISDQQTRRLYQLPAALPCPAAGSLPENSPHGP